ncbi:class I SAM-dependent methyltransferase [Spongisporangium articulatum]|uniref:Class I SAM-dependent methyltransferase n=1 Tax=Spongisporangium articulatum TaxID=3362603 RepID=A0ABW8ARI7_9ACTN
MRDHQARERTVSDLGDAGYRAAGAEETVRANRSWWDGSAVGYQEEHRGDLGGPDGFVWCPEGLREDDAHLLGDVRGLRVLEVGAGGAQCSRWLAGRGAQVVATDLSAGMLRSVQSPPGSAPVPLIQCDARILPFADGSLDAAFTAYGAVPFVADPGRIYAEVARVLRPGGRWVFAITHPIRWAFPDDPGPRGLKATRSYFDTTPYVETDRRGVVTYAEHHRTLGEQVRLLSAAGFRLVDLVEPTWPPELRRTWGGWSPRRGEIIPGTAIFVCRREDELED